MSEFRPFIAPLHADGRPEVNHCHILTGLTLSSLHGPHRLSHRPPAAAARAVGVPRRRPSRHGRFVRASPPTHAQTTVGLGVRTSAVSLRPLESREIVPQRRTRPVATCGLRSEAPALVGDSTPFTLDSVWWAGLSGSGVGSMSFTGLIRDVR